MGTGGGSDEDVLGVVDDVLGDDDKEDLLGCLVDILDLLLLLIDPTLLMLSRECALFDGNDLPVEFFTFSLLLPTS